MTKQHPTTFSKNECRRLAKACMTAPTIGDACSIIIEVANRIEDKVTRLNRRTKSGAIAGLQWAINLRKLAIGLELGRPAFRIFAKGNSKLPFWSYSELPEITCPGAGECLRFCYSFKAWRYPAGYCRQLQNTLLSKFRPELLSQAFAKLPEGITLRLFVDGDFRDIQALALWFRFLKTRPDVKAYGYSKSWQVFQAWERQGLPWPQNYLLNLSSGSKYSGKLAEQLKALPVSRGEFIATPIGKHAKGFKRFQSKAYHAEVRERAREISGDRRVFSCPGNCGECLPNGEHACGSESMRLVTIAIGEHN